MKKEEIISKNEINEPPKKHTKKKLKEVKPKKVKSSSTKIQEKN